ncbi:MAG: DNA-binding protein [Rhodocyclaceae bacterium]|nr:DNA-binding protein [Rhodocyclaceae bacterium]MBR4738233.1 DNA-binding protein [Rhodocyclaceae bacterium]
MDTTVLTITIGSIEDTRRALLAAVETGTPDATPRYTFPSAEAMARTLTPGRWRLLNALTGAEPLGVRELARRIGRDVKGVHSDAQALVLCGLVEKTADGKLHFPYEAVHVDFMLQKAA